MFPRERKDRGDNDNGSFDDKIKGTGDRTTENGSSNKRHGPTWSDTDVQYRRPLHARYEDMA